MCTGAAARVRRACVYVCGWDKWYAGSATSLLNGLGYVTSDANGNFSLTGKYACQPGDLLYIFSTGGNPGLSVGTDNAAIQMMSAIGPCSVATTTPFVTVNEATTVAAAYALGPFMTDGTHLGTSSTNVNGLKTAFANALNLVGFAYGNVLSTTPAGNGTVPVKEINSLANVLAGCVNSDGTTAACTSLFSAATPNGGSAPTNVLTAALNIAKTPSRNVAAIYALATPTGPFQPTLSPMPADWTICVEHAAGLYGSENVAVDAQGNIWVSNFTASTLSEVNGNGAVISSSVSGGGMSGPVAAAVDLTGNIWAVSQNANNVSEFTSGGTPLSGPTGYTGGGLSGDDMIAIDGSGFVWIANKNGNSVTKLNSSGVPVAGSPFTTGISAPYDMAIDNSGNVWVLNSTGGATELKSDGTFLHSYMGYGSGYGAISIDSGNNIWIASYYGNSVTKITNAGVFIGTYSGGISHPFYMAIDGGGNAWLANSYSTTVSRVSSDGSTNTSYTFPGGQDSNPGGIVIDPAGSVWMANHDSARLDQFVGAGVPTLGPLSVASANGKLGTKP